MDIGNSPSRRDLLKSAACGFGSLALSGLLGRESAAEDSHRDPLAAKIPHHLPKAKRVIFIFMMGGPSHVDTFDFKPKLQKDDGKKLKFYNPRAMKAAEQMVFGSPWKFKPYGERGHLVSELFPEQAKIIDDLCLLQGMHTEGVAHGPATLFLHTGATQLIRPSMGSWVTYGLGTENNNLPGFVTISPAPTKGGPRNYSNAFLPTAFQGTAVGRAGTPASQARIDHITNNSLPLKIQREQLEYLKKINEAQMRGATGSQRDALEATIATYELAFRMQQHAPNVIDTSKETRSTLDMYGIGKKETDDFGRQCLMARRFAEAGVRYIQVTYGDSGNTPRWDQHSNLKKHETHAKATDKPVAGLIRDLKQRGLLEDTLVWWGGEFGRTPFAQGRDGRDHNPRGFTVWLAGGGVKSGFSYGATDEYGNAAIENKMHMHDLHATILHLLGMDHEQLTYRFAGRNFRLTDVHGRVAKEIIA